MSGKLRLLHLSLHDIPSMSKMAAYLLQSSSSMAAFNGRYRLNMASASGVSWKPARTARLI